MEDELLLYYLKPKLEGKEVPGKDSIICELDLYGDQEPWKIWERFEAERSNDLRKNKDMYFFTQKKKLSAKATRSSRKVGSGTWKGQTGKNVYLLDEDQKETTTVLGSKNTYTYRNKRSAHDGRWIMYEFELKRSLLPKNRVNKNDYVLCQLRKNGELPEKKRKREQQEEVQEAGDYVEDEDGKSNMNGDHAMVVEEPQEKRQRLLPCSSDTYEAEPPFNWADLEQWFYANQAAPSSETEQEARPVLLLEDEPTVAFPGDEDLGVQNLATEENLGQQCHAMPTSAATETMASGLDSHPDANMEQQMVDMVGQDWSESHMEDLPNDEKLLNMEVGEWNDLVDFSFLD